MKCNMENILDKTRFPIDVQKLFLKPVARFPNSQIATNIVAVFTYADALKS
jgi:hypothetical protein